MVKPIQKVVNLLVTCVSPKSSLNRNDVNQNHSTSRRDSIAERNEAVQELPPGESPTLNGELVVRSRSDLDQCGWYHSEMSSSEAEDILSKCSRGTFILRNGHSDPAKYPYTLSVNYNDTVLHIRLQIKPSGFCLKTRPVDAGRSDIPQNESPIGLIELYTPFTKRRPAVRPCWSFNGELRGYITMKRPFYKEVHPLQHLCRLQLNRSGPLDKMPPGLRDFMKQYTFKF